MGVSNIANNPVEFVLSGKVYQVKRLNLMDLFAEFEVEVKKQFFDNIADYANRIKDNKERLEYQRQAIKDIPKGVELQKAVNELMETFEGAVKLLYLSLIKCNKITLEETKNIVLDQSNNAVITNLMAYITGSDQEVKKDEDKNDKKLPTGATVIPELEEKKTTTT
jgi:hypothetical protein